MMRKCMLAGWVAVTVGVAAATDWTVVNEASREEARTVLRPGEPGNTPFWNAHARSFIHPPAFEFAGMPAARKYRFTVTEIPEGKRHSFEAEHPWLPLAPVWEAVRPGYVLLVVEGVNGQDLTIGVAGSRYFYRAARFNGPYPSGDRDYAAAAQRCFEAVYRLPYVQGWLTQDEPPEGYDLYCYPAKILSSMINALVRYAAVAPQADADRALAIARKMADWLIARSRPAGEPLEFVPPTYWGDRRKTAVEYAGMNMMIYPVFAGLAYFNLAERTGEAKYGEAALRIAATMRRLQNTCGTWWLKVHEGDYTPVRRNLLVPGHEFVTFFRKAAKVSGEEGYAQVAEKVFKFLDEGPFRTWNWDGQFEDMDPMPPYVNLTHARASGFSSILFAAGRTADARETLAWCEDQFVVWSDPLHHKDWTHWKMPTALEQYDYYTPIDGSMANFVEAFAAAWTVTGEALYLEKARALADCIVRNQRPDGTIPTYFDGNGGNDWVNCMIHSAESLLTLAHAIDEKGGR